MKRVITKELALRIARKLQARDESKKGDAHAKMCIYHGGKLVASFGIRHGSSKEQGHDHIQKELNLNTGFTKELAICTKSQDDYLRKIGLLPPLPETQELSEPQGMAELPESTQGPQRGS